MDSFPPVVRAFVAIGGLAASREIVPTYFPAQPAFARVPEETPVSIENLDKIFAPKRVAVIGASDTPPSVAGKASRRPHIGDLPTQKRVATQCPTF